MPHVPILRHPTAAQTQAAHHIIASAITRAVGPSRSPARRAEVEREFLDNRAMARAIRHYGREAERQTALTAARVLGVKGSRADRIRAGRTLLARRRATDYVKPGAPHKRIGAGFATVDATALNTALGHLVGQTTLGRSGSAETQFVKHALGDVKALATGPFIAGYEGGAAGWEALHGDTSRAERLGKGVFEGLKHSAPGELVQGHPGAALEAFRQHPLLTALDFAGAASVAGRTAGAVTRAAGSQAGRSGVRGALARAGSTVRPPLALVDDAGTVSLVERRYSKDLSRKAAQVTADARREPLRRPDGSTVTVERNGRRVPVLKASDTPTPRHPRGERAALLRGEADFAASRANNVERMVRDQAAREMHVRGIRGRAARDLVSMVVEGTITSAKHFRADLESHARTLRAEIAAHDRGASVYRHSGELKAAKARLALVERALASPKVMRQRENIVSVGEAIGRRLNEHEREALRLGLLTPTRAARARRVVPAVEHLDARHFTADELKAAGVSTRYGQLRRSDMSPLSNEDIDAFLRSRGRDPESVAYLPHRLDVRGRRAFHTQFRPGSRGTMEKGESRTGAAYRKGATESSAALIREHGVRQRTQIAKAQQLDRMVGDHGITRPDGRYFTAKQAIEAADRIANDTGQRLVPVRAHAAKLDRETQRIIRDDLQGPGAMETLGLRLLNDRIVHAADEPGKARARNVVLMPAEYVEQLQKHLQPAGEIAKFFQALNRPFRFAVLSQPRWLVGNFVEAYIVRLTVVGSGLNVFGLGVDVAAATRTLRAMERSADPKVRAAAQELRAQQLGGLFIGGRGASVRRSADELAVYGEVVSKLPVVAQGADVLRLAGHALMAPAGAYFRLNRAIENVAQRAALGRDIRRDIHEFRGSWIATLRLHKRALEEAGRGLVNTSTQRRLMRSQHELLGKYEGYPPWMRRLVQTAFPFIPWALNAVRFTMWTMPGHHTALTALALKVNDVVAKDWQQIHRDTPPGALRLAIPTKRGGFVDLIRYTPWGLSGPVAEGDIGGLDQAFPVARGAYEAMHGRDPFGRRLMIDPSENAGVTEPNLLQRAGIAGNDLAEALVPYLGQLRRIREGGGTGYAGSTIVDPDSKPGTAYMSGARRALDPFRPVYLHAPSSPVASSRRRGPMSQEDRIDAALARLDAFDRLDAAEEERINRALAKLDSP